MKLEDQVCTLEQGKRLEELGVAMTPLFYHVFDGGMRWHVMPDGYFYKEEEGIEYYPAYNVAELGEMLPKMTETFRTLSGRYCCNGSGVNNKSFSCETEAQARATMLIHLLENKLIPA